MQSNNLIDNKYSFTNIVDIERLTPLFEKYSKSSGFTIGLIDNNTLEVLIKTGWHSICKNFHRADEKACQVCIKSNKILFDSLKKEKSVKIVECEHGLYDAATPIIIEGKHVANLVTGQLLMQKPNISQFEKQADTFNFDKIKYLKALDEVPIISKKKVEEVMDFLAEFASYIAYQGLNNVRNKQKSNEYYALNEELKTSEEEIRATNEELIATTEELENSNDELLETQKKIKKSEKYFKALIENSTDVISVIDAKGKSIYRSPSYTKVMGIEIEDMLGENVFDYIHKDDKPTLLKQLAETTKGKEKIAKINFRAYNGNGNLRYLQGTAKNMLHSPYVNGVVINYRDITKRVLAEQELKKSEDKFKSIFDYSQQPISITDFNGKIVDVNNKFIEITGHTKNQVIGKPVNIIDLYKDNSQRDEFVNILKKQGFVNDFEVEFTTKTGVYNVLIYANIININKIPHIVTSFANITELKQIQLKLKAKRDEFEALYEEHLIQNEELKKTKEDAVKSEENLRTLFNTMTDLVFEIDKNGKYIYIAPTAGDLMFKKPEDEVIGKTLHDVFPKKQADIFLDFVQTTINQNKTNIIKYPLIFNNKTIWFEGRATPKTKNTILYIVRDITENIKAEQQLKNNEQQLKKQNDDYAALIEELKSSEEEIRAVNEELITTTEELENNNIELFEAKEKAEKNQQQFSALFEQLPLSTQIFDNTGMTLSANKAWEDLWMASSNNVIGIYNVLEDKYAEKTGWLTHLRKAFAGKTINLPDLEYDPTQSGYTARKRILKCIAFPIKIKNKVENVVLIHQDVTEAKEYQKELVLNKEKFENLFETNPISLWEEDFSNVYNLLNDFKKQNIDDYRDYLLNNHEIVKNCSKLIKPLNINQATLDMLKAPSKEYLLNNLNKILNKKSYDFFIDELVAILKNETEISGETELVRFDNKKITVFSKIFFSKKENIVITAVTDITERKKNEIELLQAKQKAEESDLLKTEFLNNMSHEIRTPLNGILGFSKLLNTPDLQADKIKYYTDIIENSGKQLMQIIDDILEISRLETKQVKALKNEVCINNLLLQLFSIFDIKAKENKTPLYLKKALNDKQSTIYTDATKLNKILSNLIENALKFTSTGYIEIGYEIKMNSEYLVDEPVESIELEIYIKDTGIGIEKQKQKLIFDRFSQVEKEISQKVGGLGLGLSIAKENAELLGGNIRLESEKDKGTTFFVTLPYTPVFNDANIENTDNEKNTKYILIAEDEEINLLFIEELLTRSEFNIKTIHAKNGKEAIDICKQNKKLNLVLMDLKMPIINGYEATKQIKEICPNLPIIAQTAYSTKSEKEKAIKAGCDDFISKPISKEIFIKLINKYLM